jgi:MFS family permease
MPFHGRLGDLLGPRFLIILGTVVFAIGTLLCMVAEGLGLLFVGRLVQGAGAAGLNPLSLAILSREFEPGVRGKAMGTWNAAGPFTGIVGPIIGGFLVDFFSWRAIYLPMVVAAGLGFVALLVLVPKDPPRARVKRLLQTFDWGGMFLTACTLVSFVLFLSSRPVTGRAPFTDWRILIAFVVSAALWGAWERRQQTPFVAVSLFRRPQFSLASICVNARMFLMSSLTFLIPLYAADVLSIPATQTGLLITGHSTTLLLTMRFGGRLADGWSRRWAVVIGLGGQAGMLFALSMLSASSQLLVLAPMVIHGGFAGLSLASLHHVAMDEVPDESSGIGAGTYSMTRFIGSLLGASIMGIVLERALSAPISTLEAYQRSFRVAALLGVLGVALALGIRSRQGAGAHRGS